MMQVKPKKLSIYFKYICPKCHCVWERSLREIKKVGSMICDGCNSHLKFKKFDFDYSIRFNEEKPQEKIANVIS